MDLQETSYTPLGLLTGKSAIVTGAGRGIGKVIARMFRDEGARVIAADVTGDEEQTAAELGPDVLPFHVDVRDEAQIEAMFAHALASFGRVDAAIHVAGNPGGRWGEEITMEEFEAVTNVHLRGMMFCCKHAVRAMVPGGGGAIVNFSSAASFNYDPQISFAYSSAKAGINSLTKAYAGRYGAQGIRVNAIAPGFTLSEKNQGVPEHIGTVLRNKAALGRGGSSEEQANVAVFLASDRSSFVSGVTIPVDGGWTSRLA